MAFITRIQKRVRNNMCYVQYTGYKAKNTIHVSCAKPRNCNLTISATATIAKVQMQLQQQNTLLFNQFIAKNNEQPQPEWQICPNDLTPLILSRE